MEGTRRRPSAHPADLPPSRVNAPAEFRLWFRARRLVAVETVPTYWPAGSIFYTSVVFPHRRPRSLPACVRPVLQTTHVNTSCPDTWSTSCLVRQKDAALLSSAVATLQCVAGNWRRCPPGESGSA